MMCAYTMCIYLYEYDVCIRLYVCDVCIQIYIDKHVYVKLCVHIRCAYVYTNMMCAYMYTYVMCAHMMCAYTMHTHCELLSSCVVACIFAYRYT